MKATITKAKAFFVGLPQLFSDLQERWSWLGRLMATLERYSNRRGNQYAAAISFNGIVALVPVIMVSFAIAGFVLASNQGLLDDITERIVNNLEGDLGRQANDIIQSAIDSRTTVGIVGLVGAGLTGAGWLGLVRMALTEMWGGRVKQSALLGKAIDGLLFFALGIVFIATIALSVVGSGPVTDRIVDALGFSQVGLSHIAVRVGSSVVSIAAMWMLFIFILARLPYQRVPARVVAPAALVAAVVFEALKAVGGIYLSAVLSSPAGAAFGPILGIMVFAYLGSRIVLYCAAWSATRPGNEKFWVVDEVEPPADDADKPVLLAPVYDVRPTPRIRPLLTAAGVGAAAAAISGVLRRRPK